MEPKDLIKQKIDIVDVIGEYVSLKPAGSGSMKGVCPFHQERSPSFHVSRERQIFKCFGCDKGGDVFSFLMEMEGMTFVEALKQLAQRAGVELPAYQPHHADAGDKRERFLQMYQLAAQYYAFLLREHALGAAVRAYVATRNIPPALCETFLLGASLDRWDGLTTALQKKGFSSQELVEAGLCLKRKEGSGIFDRFRNRLMIPLCNAQGQVIAFTARVLPGTPDADQAGKYVNSPETLLYKKSEMLFGLHLAKTAIRKTGEVIIVEGNLDVIASHAAGVAQVVASSGTALTLAQIQQLGRYTHRLIFCLDDDAAGFAAAKRALDLALTLQTAASPFDIRCLIIPEGAGKDPDEIVQKNPETWRTLCAHSVSIIAYVFEKTLRMFRAHEGNMTIDERTRLVDALLPYIARLHRADEQHLYLLQLADATHVTSEVLRSMMTRYTSPSPSSDSTAPTSSSQAAPSQPQVSFTPQQQALAFLFAHALSDITLTEVILQKIRGGTSPLPEPWQYLYDALFTVYTSAEFRSSSLQKSQTLFSQLRAYLDRTPQGAYADALDRAVLFYDEIVAGLSHEQRQEEARRQLLLLARARMEEQKKYLEAAIRHAETSGDNVLLGQLMTQYHALLVDFRKVL